MTQSYSTVEKNLNKSSHKNTKIMNRWWGELRHGGLLISPAVLEEIFPKGPKPVEQKRIERLYDAYLKFITNEEIFTKNPSKLSENLYRWIDAVFESFLDVPTTSWLKENKVPDELKVKSPLGELLRPNRVLTYFKDYRYLIKIDKEAKTLGLGKSKRKYSKFLDLLRKTKIQLGVYTNGHQIRLVYAGLDHDSWVEWDVTRWFEDLLGEELLAGFFQLCGRSLNFKFIENKWALLHYVQYSRIKQSDLSSVLGTQVREAVEILLEILDASARDIPNLLDPLLTPEISDKQRLNALYQAGIRLIMRMVVIFFAEARDLFPRSMERYDQSYGLEGLFRILTEAEQEEGQEILKNSITAWARLLALFNLIYDGSSFSDIPIRPYGGVLFRPGNSEVDDLISRAISIFEDPRLKISDFTILKILRKLKIGKVKVKKGRNFAWVHGPVDFSELSAEYIGMMYEGLLDYQVRQVSENEEAIIILKLGRQPALPITRLESLSDKEIRDLIKNLSKEKVEKIIKEEESEESDEEGVDSIDFEEIDEEKLETEEEIEYEEEEVDLQPTQEELYLRALDWAKKAVTTAKLVKKTKKITNDQYTQLLTQRAKKIISRDEIYGKGQYYLIQSSGNRKGSGTFYTKPQLVIPTVLRTLEPLVYDTESDGTKIPKKPEEILALKVLDPAMGSASFLVAALRYLSDVLYESLLFHGQIRDVNSNKTVITIPFGKEISGDLKEDTFTITAIEKSEMIEVQIKSRLKRHIMERCIYGVDINQLAVELAKLSLWVETLDRNLPFTFIDHKLKVGNSMIGCYLSDFRDYPVMAWHREAGDSTHSNGVYYKKEEWTKAIKKFKNEVIKPKMVQFIERLKGQTEITDYLENLQKESLKIKTQILKNYLELHQFDKFDITKVDGNVKKEKFYLDHFQNDLNFQYIKQQMDLWCAIWFWDPDKLDICPTPLNYLQASKDTLEYVKYLTAKYRFFHWEIEFPDVFFRANPGFDVILGNPPWETLQASSMEYFSEFDPIYRTSGKQDALNKQKEFFNLVKDFERSWLIYTSYYKFFKNWIDNAFNPFGDYMIGTHFNFAPAVSHWTKSQKIHETWRNNRNMTELKFNKQKRYKLQGKGKAYTYKLFAELTIKFLAKNGRIGLIVQAGIFGDQGAKDLRKFLLENMKWEYMICFENKYGIFPSVHRSFKFCIIIIESSDSIQIIKTKFMVRDLLQWENIVDKWIKYKKDAVYQFSPENLLFLEIELQKDLNLLMNIHKNIVTFNAVDENSWDLNFYREFNTTDDSKYFPPIYKWKEKGYYKDDYCRWCNSDGDIAIPIYEGRMIGQFDFSKKGWVEGKGRSAIWRKIPFEKKTLEPEFLISEEKCDEIGKRIFGYKVSFRKVTTAISSRTIISFLDRDSPHTDGCPIIYTNDHSIIKSSLLTAIMNSFIFDYIMKFRVSGTNVNYFRLEEAPLPIYSSISQKIKNKILQIVSKLTFIHIKFAQDWLYLASILPEVKKEPWKRNWAVTKYERLRLRVILDAIIAHLYNLSFNEFNWILRDNPNNPKGFWRVDKEDPKEIRLTTLALKAYEYLLKVGIEKFCEEEWQIPRELLDKLKEELGPRFLDWQLEQSVEESWNECQMHVKNILGEDNFQKFMKDIEDGKDPFAVQAKIKEKEREERKSKSKKKSKKANAGKLMDKFLKKENSTASNKNNLVKDNINSDNMKKLIRKKTRQQDMSDFF